MIKLQGVITKVFPTQTFGNFDKRVFWLHDNAQRFPNTWQLELWKQDCAMLDNYKEGDFITAYVDIKGQKWEKEGTEPKVMNTLKCWNIEKDGVTFKPI